MENPNLSNKRIARNTILLYARMLLVMAVSLFTSRVVLASLGVVDYGIYGVVGGFVAMFSVFSNSLSAAIQRFITYEIGRGDIDKIKKVFSTSVTIMIIVSVCLMLLAEIIGWWFINNKMVIPEDRVNAAIWVMHCSVLTFGISLISVPYNASIISHEKMSAFAYISIYEVIAKLAICYSLYISPIDRLVTWALMLAILQFSVRAIYGIYCKRKFVECSFSFSFDSSLFKEMFSYAGWSSFGLVALTCYTHGLNMVLNFFFGPVVNAARAIAVQVQGAVQGFSTNFQVALNPQIIKSYAQGDLMHMHELIFSGSRYSFYMLFLLSFPIILETPFLLNIWLGDYPEHTVNFIRLALILITFDSSLGGPISTAQTATGNIKIYQIFVGGIMLLILPTSYMILKLFHTPPETVYYVYMCAVIIAHLTRMIIVHKTLSISIRDYFRDVLFPILKVLIFACPIPLIVFFHNTTDDIISFFVVVCVCLVSVGVVIYTVGITTNERKLLTLYVNKLFHVR